MAASIPDDSRYNGEQTDCSANCASRNCANVRTRVVGVSGDYTDGHCTLLASTRKGEAEVSNETENDGDGDGVLEAKFAGLFTRARRTCRELSWTFYTFSEVQAHIKVKA